ncbi:MAG: hypothetical protein ACQEP5_04165 [Actinomycetota bacterium]
MSKGSGKNKKTWVFNRRLWHGRLNYYEKEYDQKVDVFIRCRKNASDFSFQPLH